ncbi:phage holin family protein [Polaribacter aestuariivivens]|uniref:Phage holin family protein n=1 Tax=Polaribacter aestuariivivens TaxID=2304626 RepID=A0A5S3NB30_9FLAO|nr:phage holin family protein [Polaribacter aestuariivivens]TMM32327.1 phage holin family protein [Polaribacter aestuariivivens]
MSIFESLNNSSDSGVDKGKKYVNATYEYYKLKAFHTLTVSFSTISKLLVIGGLILIGLMFSSVALAIVLGDFFESVALGYLAVGGIFFVLGIFIFLGRKQLDKSIIRIMSNKFSK